MIRFALVGCGRVATRHADLLSTNSIPNARLVAVCDVSEQRAKAFSAKYAVPYFTDMEAMFDGPTELDAVSVLTPSGMHPEHVVRLSRHKKHIVVEKPMALHLDDADRMIRACDENGIRLFVIKQNRFNLPVVKLKEAIDEGRFGKLVMGTVRVRWCRTQEYYDSDGWRGTWANDGGVFTNQASHHIDLLEWLMGSPVESVFAKSRTALVNIETEDTGIAILTFANGALGVVEATTATRPTDLEGSVSILGENGSVVIGGFAANEMTTWKFKDHREGDDEIAHKCAEAPPDVYGFGHKRYYEHVVDCITNNRQALVDGLEGRKSLELINAIYESVETGEEIVLRFKPSKSRLGLK